MEERSSFGIKAFDDALNGGIPNRSLVLLSGGPGTGKSTLCLHFLINGAKTGKKGLYVSTEQTEEELIKQSEKYDWELAALIKKGLIQIIHIDILDDSATFKNIIEAHQKQKPERMVIDSLTTFSEYLATTEFSRDLLIKRGGVANRTIDQIVPKNISERTMTKRMLATMIERIKGLGSTTIMISELPEKTDYLSSDGISEFLADGVIVLHHLGVGLTQFRSLQIKKMRYTGHSNEYLAYDFKQSGIEFVENAV
jgi:KaiC/GvpD/RAD55 family RecA-like ATPase